MATIDPALNDVAVISTMLPDLPIFSYFSTYLDLEDLLTPKDGGGVRKITIHLSLQQYIADAQRRARPHRWLGAVAQPYIFLLLQRGGQILPYVNKGIVEWPRWQPSREAKILGASGPAPISALVFSTALPGPTIFSTLFIYLIN
jgi:hypothetical protein